MEFAENERLPQPSRLPPPKVRGREVCSCAQSCCLWLDELVNAVEPGEERSLCDNVPRGFIALSLLLLLALYVAANVVLKLVKISYSEAVSAEHALVDLLTAPPPPPSPPPAAPPPPPPLPPPPPALPPLFGRASFRVEVLCTVVILLHCVAAYHCTGFARRRRAENAAKARSEAKAAAERARTAKQAALDAAQGFSSGYAAGSALPPGRLEKLRAEMQRAQAGCDAAELEARQAAEARRRAVEAETRDLDSDRALAAVAQAAFATYQGPLGRAYLLWAHFFATEWVRASFFLPRPPPSSLLDLATKWSPPTIGSHTSFQV